jgi:cytochrome c oxidase subunit IV
MSDHAHADNFSSHVRRYLIVFFALIIGTVFTVWASYIDLGHYWNIVLALVIACTKAFLVAGFFMHLMSERKMIYCILAFTVFFFAGLMYLTLWSLEPNNLIQIRHVP